MKSNLTITLIGAGNLGSAIINGLLETNFLKENKLTATKRNLHSIHYLKDKGVVLGTNNKEAIENADVIIVCVQPGQLSTIADEIKDQIQNATIISTVTGATLERLHKLFGNNANVVRAMPNTAIAVRQSMTCISSNAGNGAIDLAKFIFSKLGETIVIDDGLMQAATVLGASGIAFWLRLIRASTQGGIQLGFDAPEAQKIAVQACLGAATLLSGSDSHPEPQIDKVTTPMGCTIAGLNEMEHMGLSSAVIKGLVVSFNQINKIKQEQS